MAQAYRQEMAALDYSNQTSLNLKLYLWPIARNRQLSDCLSLLPVLIAMLT